MSRKEGERNKARGVGREKGREDYRSGFHWNQVISRHYKGRNKTLYK